MPSSSDIWYASLGLTVAGIFYFRAICTSDHTLAIGQRFGYELPDSEYHKLVANGPIRWNDYRVLVATLMLTTSTWLSPWLHGTYLHSVLIVFSLGAFLSPLSMPSANSPEGSDLKAPGLFIAKWLSGSFDSWLKTLLLWAICFVVLLIPGISNVGQFLSDGFLPIVPDKPGSTFFREILDGALAAMCVMFVIRISLIGAHGFWIVCSFIFSSSFIWIQYQWFVNEVFAPEGSFGIMLGLSLFATIFLQFIQDVLGSIIDNTVAEPRR